MDVDFVELGSGPTIVRQVWVANVEMAISVAKVARGNFCTQDNLRLLHMPTHKFSSNLRNKPDPNYTSFEHTRYTTVKQPGTMTPEVTQLALLVFPSLLITTHGPIDLLPP